MRCSASRSLAAAALALAAALGPLAAQDDAPGLALRRFEELFQEAVKLGAGPELGQFRAARDKLAEAESLVDQLPPERRERARFGVAVRRAEVLLRADNQKEAGAQALAARARFAADGATYAGSHRVLLLVILWNALPAEAWRPIAAAEREYLLAETTERNDLKSARYLKVPLRLLRCSLLFDEGQLERALRQQGELATELLADAKADPQWRRKCIGELAWSLLVLHDYARARPWLDALPAAETRYPRALIALHLHDYATAEREARDLVLQDPRHAQLLADALERQGRADEALVECERALAAAQSPLDRASALNTAGDCLLAKGDLAAAQSRYDAALAQLGLAPDNSQRALEIAECRKDLGRIAAVRGEAQAGSDQFLAALDELERTRQLVPADAFGIAWLDDWRLEAIEGALDVAAAAGHDGFWSLALLERGKERGLLDFAWHPPAPRDHAALQRAVRDLALTADPLQLQDRRLALETARLPRAAPAAAAPRLDADALRAAAAAEAEGGTTIVSYWIGERRAHALLVEGGTCRQLVLGSRAEALAAVEAALAAVRSPAHDPAPELALAARCLFGNGIDACLARARHVVVVPDRVTGGVPFEALPLAGAGGRALGLAVDVERAPSLSLRALLRERTGGGDVVLLDSVEIPAAEQAEFAAGPLRFAALEGERVAGAHGAVRRLSGAEATLAGLRGLLEAAPAGILHVNTHAVQSERTPSASLLLLANGATDMAAFATLPLRGARVVLSACESAGGSMAHGEGTKGLLFGVFGAGARAAVASLWPQNQQATADFMAQLHHHLGQGVPLTRSLRLARATLAAAPQYAHPYYWAGFVAFGPDEADPGGRAWPPLILLGLAAALALGAAFLWRNRRR